MADVALLDFAGPPPGYAPHPFAASGGRFAHAYVDHLSSTILETQFRAHDAALKIVWDHYKARFDPPGMSTRWAGGTYAEPGRRWVWVLFFEHNGAKYNLVQDFKSAPQDVARAAAWRWYEARVELYNILRKLNPPREFWPLILTWSDQQWIEVHTFIVEHADVIMSGAADGLTFPTVLRG